MKKHYHAVRVVGLSSMMPHEELIVFGGENHVLTIDDFAEFNKSNQYQFVQSFYIGFTCIDGARKKLNCLNIKNAAFHQ